MKIRLPAASSGTDTHDRTPELLLEIYRRMFLIRNFELRVNQLFLQGLVPGTMHLSHGQEATTVGTCLALHPKDAITMTHRGHGQALAKGMAPNRLLAEILGKRTGVCKGKGGSMHIGDMTIGAFPATAIIAEASPVATGLAFAFKRHRTGQVACNFFGEGTVNKGDWHEAMNLAAVWSLPVLFLCENNLYASTTNISEVMLNESVAERAHAYHMPGLTIDGNDPLAVYDAVQVAGDRARQGEGPTLVECLTYRQGGHKREDPGTYRPDEEVQAWLKRDPIVSFRAKLLADSRFTEDQIAQVEAAVRNELDAAADFALASEYPDQEEALTDVYA